MTNGLILNMDISNNQSFRGEPTTNIAGVNFPNLNFANWWNNSGTAIFLDNDTSVSKPNIHGIDTYNLYVGSAETTVVGQQHFGTRHVPVSPSTEYTFSCYFRWSGGNLNIQPYLRSWANNNNLGLFTYNGDSNYNNWPVDTWIRLSKTVTTASNETDIFLSLYIGDIVGQKICLFGYQVEQKSYFTYFTTGVRGSTIQTGGGVIDTATYIHSASLMNDITYSSDGKGSLIFDGSDQYLDLGNSHNDLVLDTGGSLCVWSKWNSYNGTSWSNTLIGKGGSSWPNHHYILFKESGTNHLLFSVSNGTSYLATNGPSGRNIPLDTWFYTVATWDSTYKKLYYNNELEEEVNSNIMPINSSDAVSVGRTGTNGYYLDGKISLVQIYNRAISHSEVIQNFNAFKSRFGI